MACQSCSGTRSSVVVMAADHAAEQGEQQEPAEARKHALSPVRTAILERIPALLSSDDFGSRVERAALGQVLWPAHRRRSAVNVEQHGRWTGSGECCSSTRVERRGALRLWKFHGDVNSNWPHRDGLKWPQRSGEEPSANGLGG